MRIRVVIPLIALALSAAACGGGNDTGGTTGSTGGTGASGSATIAKFTTVAQDAEGGNTLSASGVSCDGLTGPYTVTFAVQGNLSGQATATLTLVNGSKGTLKFSMPVTGAESGTLSGQYKVELSPLANSGTMLVTGVTTVESSSGMRTFPVSMKDIPVNVGTGACPNP
jgi:hypothetical protein